MTRKCCDNKCKRRRRDPLLTILIVLFVIILIVAVGTIGYRIFAHMPWIDAFHNGALVFTATTVVTPIETYNGKIFSAIYNIISAVFALFLLGVILSSALINFRDDSDTEDGECCSCRHNKSYNNTISDSSYRSNSDSLDKCDGDGPLSSDYLSSLSDIIDE